MCLATFLAYCPELNTALCVYGLMLEWWSLALSFSILMLVYDEVRKLIIRRHPGGVVNSYLIFILNVEFEYLFCISKKPMLTYLILKDNVYILS